MTDFLFERTENDRQLRLLAVVDEHNRESLAIRRNSLYHFAGCVAVLFTEHCTPQHIRSDNGPEFVTKSVRGWLKRANGKALFIANGGPWEIGYVESYNGKLRDELLNRELFLSLAETRWVIDRWRLDYNNHRPHSARKS